MWSGSSGARSGPGVDGSGSGSRGGVGSATGSKGPPPEAICRATLLAPGKQPGWLTAAVAEAERALIAQAAEPPDDPGGSEDGG
jgi:hypothetical protein